MKRLTSRKIGLMLVIIILLISVPGCHSGEAPEGHNHQIGAASENQVQSFSVIYDLDQVFALPPVKIGLVNVGVVTNTIYEEGDNVQRGHVALGLEIANTADENVWFYPEQIQVILNSGEKLTADVSISSDIGGNFPERHVKKGFLLFPIYETEPELITDITLVIAAPLDTEYEPLGENQKLVISLS